MKRWTRIIRVTTSACVVWAAAGVARGQPRVGVGIGLGYPAPYGRYISADSSLRILVQPKNAAVYVDGYFVGLPSRDQLFVLPVVKEAVVFLYLMKGIVDKEFKTAPYPISSDLFWVRGGAWHVFPVEVDLVNKRLSLTPPEDLVPILDRFLAEEEQADEERPMSDEPEPN